MKRSEQEQHRRDPRRQRQAAGQAEGQRRQGGADPADDSCFFLHMITSFFPILPFRQTKSNRLYLRGAH